MPSKVFGSSSSNLHIEVDEIDGGSGASYAASLADALDAVLAPLGNTGKSLEHEGAPSEFTVGFSLIASEDGGFVVTADPAKGNFRVNLKWSKPDDPTAGLDMPTQL